MIKRLFFLLLALTALGTAVACGELNAAIEMAVATPEPAVETGAGGWYEIYFTNPTCPEEAARQGGLDEIIAADLQQAEWQVDVAAFDLDAPPIVDALIALEGRGVTVRVVTDTDNAGLSSINRLRRHGISVVEDDRSALMHNKFIVIDGRYTWLGSLNFTTNGAYCNNNNLVRIDSPALAANYLTEMDEMVDDRAFGPRSPQNTPNEQITIGNVFLENYFAPEKELAPLIGSLVSQAQNDIRFLAFSFTHEAIGEPMIERAEAGVNVQGVFESVGSQTEYSYYGEMVGVGLANLQVRQDGNPQIMHHKVIIIDGQITILGSFNFTGNANDNNDENILIVHDPEFAGYFLEEFGAVWQEAQP